MVRAGRGLWPFRHRRLLSPRAGRRVLSASVPAPLVGRCIGPPPILLSPLAGMAAGMALLAPGSAQAQTYLTIWSATLTVDERIVGSHSWHGCDNGGPQEKCSTALDDDDFTYAGRTYTIVSMNRTISQGERLLTVIFDGGAAIAPEIKDYATLHAGTKSFSFRTASTTSVSNSRYVTWTNPGLSWTDNQEVALSIRVPLTVTAAPDPVNGQVTLSWNQVPGASYYRYKVWEGTGTDGRVIRNWRWLADARLANPRTDRTTLALTNSGVVSGLDNGTTYTFKIHEMRSTFIERGSWWRWRSGLESNAVTVTPAGPPPTRCTSTITGDGSVTGRWSGRYRFGDWIPECASAKRGDNYAAQYYRLTLDQESRVTLDLRSSAAGTHLYLWGGINRQSGTPLAEDSGPFWRGSGFSSRIERTLAAGVYTVEATTFAELDDGQFTLTVGGLGGSTPDAVSDLNVTHNGDNLAVRWTAPALAASYDVTYYNRNTGVNARAAWRRAGTSLIIRCDSRDGMQNQNCIERRVLHRGGEGKERQRRPHQFMGELCSCVIPVTSRA